MSYIAKIKIQAEKKDLDNLSNGIGKRFTGIAKKFGSGLKTAINFGMKSLTAIATGNIALGGLSSLISALLNPFNEATETLNSTLSKADNIDTRAKQFGTTSSNYLKLQSAAQVKGVDQASFDMGLTKFQSALGEAKLAELQGQKHFLSEFTKYNDTVVAYYRVIQSLQNIGKAGNNAEMVNLASQLFGDRVVGKYAEFLQADNLEEIMTNLTKGISNTDINTLTAKGGELQEKQAFLNTELELKSYFERLKNIDEGMLEQQNSYNKLIEQQKTNNLKNYDNMVKIAIDMELIKKQLQEIFIKLQDKIAPTADKVFNWLANSSFFDAPTKEGIKEATNSIKNIDNIIARDLLKKFGVKGTILDAMEAINNNVKELVNKFGNIKNFNFFK
ncbi:MAG: hypothetical protein LBF97_04620 [Elusimicrobiota bacterium]|jgi:hypothetical protein|nr:hypothetical protein [Elusimicrobiota bacterium]